jgi:hypothetical protein
MMKRLAATVAVGSLLSTAFVTTAEAKTKPKGQKKLDLHALVACTGLDVSAHAGYFLGQPPDPNVMFNVVTGLTRSKTRDARKQLASLQATSGEGQYPAINSALTWCTDRDYTRRLS